MGSILITAQVEFLSSGFFSIKKTPTHLTQPLMRDVKGLLTTSFHQPKALPAPSLEDRER